MKPVVRKIIRIGALTSVICSTVVLQACSSSMIIPPNGKYGPTDGEKIGKIRYLAEGAGVVIDSRRNDALKKMYEACNGHYKILGDTSKDKLMGSYGYDGYGGSGFVGSMEYIYISFQCTKN